MTEEEQDDFIETYAETYRKLFEATLVVIHNLGRKEHKK